MKGTEPLLSASHACSHSFPRQLQERGSESPSHRCGNRSFVSSVIYPRGHHRGTVESRFEPIVCLWGLCPSSCLSPVSPSSCHMCLLYIGPTADSRLSETKERASALPGDLTWVTFPRTSKSRQVKRRWGSFQSRQQHEVGRGAVPPGPQC